ncbi:hypothetical protein B0T25DRAFT_568911 [Lasiosphaeria hispida]|uniref:Uncharacterized protein n=1 Tax=Lasiosphaeria hispida TaxID=260671 RepID=A0AAJ0MEQ2_9PEZI|nr:hypothetical protein B0T25DRAFT_568911 [Lasiosphaeria hispida]
MASRRFIAENDEDSLPRYAGISCKRVMDAPIAMVHQEVGKPLSQVCHYLSETLAKDMQECRRQLEKLEKQIGIDLENMGKQVRLESAKTAETDKSQTAKFSVERLDDEQAKLEELVLPSIDPSIAEGGRVGSAVRGRTPARGEQPGPVRRRGVTEFFFGAGLVVIAFLVMIFRNNGNYHVI